MTEETYEVPGDSPAVRHPKCGHCPLSALDRPCRGQNNQRACSLTDPASPDYRPEFAEVLLAAPPLPSVLRRVVNFVGAAIDHLAEGMKRVSDEVIASRLAICRANSCGYYREDDRCAHTGCGCFLAVKVSWAEQSCPLNPPLWGPAESASDGAASPS